MVLFFYTDLYLLFFFSSINLVVLDFVGTNAPHSSTLEVPIFWFIHTEPLLVDKHYQAKALSDMVIVVQSEISSWESHLQCNGKSLVWDMRLVQGSLVFWDYDVWTLKVRWNCITFRVCWFPIILGAWLIWMNCYLHWVEHQMHDILLPYFPIFSPLFYSILVSASCLFSLSLT